MIPIPNLPTDSLYKFIFVGGVLMILSSFYLLNQKSDTLYDSIKNSDAIQLKLQTEDSLDTLLAKQYLDEFQIHKKQAEFYVSHNLVDSAERRLSKMRDLQNGTLRLLKKANAKYLMSTSEIKILDNIQKQYNNDVRLLYVLLFLGLVLTTCGYFGWQYRIQIPQDRMTKIQLELMEIQLKKASQFQSTLKYTKSSPPFYKFNSF